METLDDALHGIRERDRVEAASMSGVGRQCGEDRRHTVRRSVAPFDFDVDDGPAFSRGALELLHQAGLAHPPGSEHQNVLALLQFFPEIS